MRGLGRRIHLLGKAAFHSMDRRVNPRIKSGGGDDGYLRLSRSAGGAISATRSRTSALFDNGFTIISRGSSRVVQAYAVAPSISIMHSLQALALMQENRSANVGSRFARTQRRPSRTDWPGSNGTSWLSNCPAGGASPRQIRNRAVASSFLPSSFLPSSFLPSSFLPSFAPLPN